MGLLFGSFDQAAGELTITRPNGQTYKTKNAAMTAGSHKVFTVETVEKEVHVLTGPHNNRQPSRRVKFSDSASYKGSSGL